MTSVPDPSDDEVFEPPIEYHHMSFDGQMWLSCSCGWAKIINSYYKMVEDEAAEHRRNVINQRLGLEFSLT